MRNAFLHAELLDPSFAFATVFCFQRSRTVIDSGMEHSRIVPGLVLSQFFLFFEQGEGQMGVETAEFMGGGKADNPSADDDYIRLCHEKNGSALAG